MKALTAQAATLTCKALYMAQASFEIFTHVLLIFVIGEAFGTGDPATAEDAGLQIGDDGVDLIRRQRARGRIEIIRRRPDRPIVASANLVGALIKGRHAGAARTSAADHELECCSIEPRCSQVGAGRRHAALLVTVVERPVARRAARCLPAF